MPTRVWGVTPRARRSWARELARRFKSPYVKCSSAWTTAIASGRSAACVSNSRCTKRRASVGAMGVFQSTSRRWASCGDVKVNCRSGRLGSSRNASSTRKKWSTTRALSCSSNNPSCKSKSTARLFDDPKSRICTARLSSPWPLWIHSGRAEIPAKSQKDRVW